MASLIKIDILEVKNPSKFTARVVLPSEQDVYEKAWCHLQNEMDVIEKNTVINHNVRKKEVCAVKDSRDHSWHRVRVEQIFYTSRGERARCCFVDSGEHEEFALARLFLLPDKYQCPSLPFHVRTLKLWGLQPMSLQIEATPVGLHVPQRPTKEWDASAESFFCRLIQDCDDARVKVMHQEGTGQLQVCLYLSRDQQLINVNDLLIEEEYACPASADVDEESDSSMQARAAARVQKKTRLFPSSNGYNVTDSASGFSPQLVTRHADSSSSAHASDTDVPAKKVFQDRAVTDSEMLSEERMKQVMAKVHRFCTKNKPQSDTEDKAESYRGAKVESTYVVTSPQSDSNAGSIMGAVGNNCKRQDAFASAVPGTGGWPLSGAGDPSSGLLVDVTDSLSPHSRTSNQLHSIVQDTESSPELISLQHTVSGTTRQYTSNICPEVQDVSGLNSSSSASGGQKCAGQGLSASNPTSSLAAGVNASAAKSRPAGVGRGRGLRKLYSNDVLATVVERAPSSVSDSGMKKEATGLLLNPSSGLPVNRNLSYTATYENIADPSSCRVSLTAIDQSPGKTVPAGEYAASKDKVTFLNDVYARRRRDNAAESENIRGAISGVDLPRHAPVTSPVLGDDISDSSLSDCRMSEGRKKSNMADLLLKMQKGTHGKASALVACGSGMGRGGFLGSGVRAQARNSQNGDTTSLAYLSRKKLNGKAIGQNLLDLLGGYSSNSEEDTVEKVPLVWRPDRPMPDPFLGTIVFGTQPPRSVYDVNEVPFHETVKLYILKEGFRTPRSIQANTWPAILRGRSVIGILPPSSGKTTAYLPPLVSELLKSSQYLRLPKGCGPKAIILVPSCKKADSIFNYVDSILSEKKNLLRVLRIYGCEEHQVLPLLRGCDLLIATPSCLLRMIDRRYTYLDRLCHLVLDGVEVLVDQFNLQVQQLMKEYAEKLKQYQTLPVPRQIMTFGSQWSQAVAEFQRAYQVDPVLVFASRLEASVYGQVRQVVHMCFDKQHLTTLEKLVESLMAKPKPQHIVIATASPEDLRNISELLKSMSIYAQVIAHDSAVEMVDYQVQQWREQTGSSPVLVVTDNNVTTLHVPTADVVVHFDLPDSKTKFGNRLALMKAHFVDICGDKQKQDGVEAVSYLLVTNKMLDNVQSLHSFLVRSGATIPPTMTKLLEGMHLGKNEDENRPLCVHLKQFGKCSNEQNCSSRHLVLPCDIVKDTGEDSWPPASGTVKVRILRVIDTSHFYMMLLEHQVPGGEKRDLQLIHTTLTWDLHMYFANPKNHVPYCMEQGLRLLAAVKDEDGLFHRARVLSPLQATLRGGSSRVQVNYVDEGRTLTVRPDQLLKLPQNLQDVPPLAVEVFACRVQPADTDSSWTGSSSVFAATQLKEKALYGSIVLRMKDTLWLDPLAQQTRLTSLKTNVVSMVYRSELLKRGMAEDNPDHIKNLYKLCEGKTDIPKKLYEKYTHMPPPQKLEIETLAADELYHKVCISVVDDPGNFYIQKSQNQKELELLGEELNKYMAKFLKAKVDAASAQSQGISSSLTDPSATASPSNSPALQLDERADEEASSPNAMASASQDNGRPVENRSQRTAAEIKKGSTAELPAVRGGTRNSSVSLSENRTNQVIFEQGSVCVAKFHDGSWYRGQLVEKVDKGWTVFFMDYGEQEAVPESDIHRLPDGFLAFPAQAIECSLMLIKPIGEEWSEESGDALWDLAHYANGDRKSLLLKKFAIEEAVHAGVTKHVVELYDTCSTSHDMRFSQELVWLREATTEDDKLQTLFPKSTYSSRRMYRNLDEKIKDLCAALYWADEEKAEQLSVMVADGLISDLIVNDDEKEFPALQNAVKLIGYLKSCDAQPTLLAAVVKCVEMNPELCAEAVKDDLVQRLIICLEQSRNPAVQLHAAITAVQLIKTDGFTQCMDQPELVSVMADTLKADDPTPEMLKQACSFLTCVLTRGKECSEVVKATGVCQVSLDLMSETNDPDTLECLLALLAAMAMWETLQSSLVREKAVQQILSTMREAASQECVFQCARICQSLCRASRRNKRILLEGELVLIIRDLLEAGLQSPAQELCEELNASLAVSAPQQEVLAGVHFTTPSVDAGSSTIKVPTVKWSQNSFRVLLTVSVQGAKESDFTITKNEINFKCETGGTKYGFDYTLFGDLVPDKCWINVHSQEVLMSLKKLQEGTWSRLLKEKCKLPNLMPDLEHLVDSSDSEVEDPDNITQLGRERVMRLPKQEEEEWEGNVYDTFEYSCSDDSDESDLGNYTDDERFEDPSEFIDPIAVLDSLIETRAAQSLGKRASVVELSDTGSGQ